MQCDERNAAIESSWSTIDLWDWLRAELGIVIIVSQSGAAALQPGSVLTSLALVRETDSIRTHGQHIAQCHPGFLDAVPCCDCANRSHIASVDLLLTVSKVTCSSIVS